MAQNLERCCRESSNAEILAYVTENGQGAGEKNAELQNERDKVRILCLRLSHLNLREVENFTYDGTVSHLVSRYEFAAQEIVNKGAKDEK